ncbi:MAG: hypothetical protein LBR88_07400 [Zoogloeaceae bacterium]|jgi:hypothetical protein|nr:hypothetical protein [Zoogloeaceae bacterium]
MKQNAFVNIEDFMDDAGFVGVAWVVGVLLFISLWIVGGSFWAALIFAAIIGPTLGGLVALFIACISMMFVRREEDQMKKPWHWHLVNFLIPLPGVIMSGSFLYAAYLMAVA